MQKHSTKALNNTRAISVSHPAHQGIAEARTAIFHATGISPFEPVEAFDLYADIVPVMAGRQIQDDGRLAPRPAGRCELLCLDAPTV